MAAPPPNPSELRHKSVAVLSKSEAQQLKMYLEIASGEKARREAAAKAEEEAALGSMGGGAAAGSDGSSGLSKSLYFGALPDTMTALKIARKLVDAGEKVEAGTSEKECVKNRGKQKPSQSQTGRLTSPTPPTPSQEFEMLLTTCEGE